MEFKETKVINRKVMLNMFYTVTGEQRRTLLTRRMLNYVKGMVSSTFVSKDSKEK